MSDSAILADVLKATAMPVAILDPRLPDQPMVFVNAAFCALTGLDPDGLLGRNLDMLHAPEGDAAALARLRGAVAAGELASIALIAARKDGSRFHTRLVLAPAAGEDGRPRHVIAALSDVAAPDPQAPDARQRREAREWQDFCADAGLLSMGEVNLQTKELRCTALLRQYFGRTAEEPFTFADMMSQIHPEDVEGMRYAASRAIREGTHYDHQFRVIHPDGAIVWLHGRGKAAYAADGTPLRLAGVALDVTERRTTEQRLAMSEESLRLALQFAAIDSWDADIPRARLTYSDNYKKQPSSSPGAMSLAEFRAWLHPDDKPAVSAAFAAMIDPAIRADLSVQCRTVNPTTGKVRWTAARGRGVFDGDVCIRACGIALDITQQQLAHRRQAFMLALLERLRGLTDPREIMRTAAMMLGAHLDACRTGYGEIQEDGETVTLETGYAAEVAPLAGSFALAALDAGLVASQRRGDSFVTADRQAEPGADPADPMLAPARAVLCVPLLRDASLQAFLYVTCADARDWLAEDIRLVEDVAARTWDAVQRARAEAANQRARLAAEATAAQHSAILRQLSEGVIVTDAEGRITFANDAAIRIHGIAPLNVGPADYSDAYPLFTLDGEPYRAEDLALTSAVKEGKTVRDRRLRIRRPNQDEVIASSTAQPILGPDGRQIGAVLTIRDDTARSKAQCALTALNKTLEAKVAERTRERDMVWELSPDLFGICGFDRVYRSLNPTWLATNGLTLEQMRDYPYGALAHPDDLPTALDALERLKRGEVVRDMDIRSLSHDGTYRCHSWTLIPHDDGFYATGRDVTERKRLEEELRQSQKMEAVGQLTGGMAHDFNNLLTGIAGSLEVLQARIEQGRTSDLTQYLEAAQDAATRASALTHRLLAFSRRQTLDPRPTDAARLVAGMVEMVRRTVGPAIAVTMRGDKALWSTLVDPSQLENALLNLCINARDAMPDGGALTIVTQNETFDLHDAHEAHLPPGDYVTLRVEDSGTGMTPETARRAFDPFFTTKKLGEGTGLGLSMIHGFARQSGGQVQITSKPGMGTSVSIHLPRHDVAEAPARPVAEPPANTGPARGQTVLVVDDEPTVRMLVTEILSGLGHVVLEAEDGASGLRLLQSDTRIDLLVTDVGLPGGMNGRQMVDAARPGRPALKVLFITGYAEAAVFGPGPLGPDMNVLTKPFSMRTLSARIRMLTEAG